MLAHLKITIKVEINVKKKITVFILSAPLAHDHDQGGNLGERIFSLTIVVEKIEKGHDIHFL